ncbi:uncharacterized mitochondrial protein AtMg00810-like [Malus domestica]|uniref:uncharacterized mitochondrial protein AtMg00810-like n=1 Tax=Malus domestica TaxID=3750 RepID=UPI003976285D
MKLKSLSEIYAMCNLCIVEPENFEEAEGHIAWKKAMEDEMAMIEKNSTWEIVNRRSDKPVIGVKWVYKAKLNLDGTVQKNKARLVAKGYSQQPGVDFNETFALGIEGIFIHQKKYAQTLLDKFGLKGCKSVATLLISNEKLIKDDGTELADSNLYRKIVGSFFYLTATKPNVIFAASLLSRFMHNPTKIHIGIAKRVLRYIAETIDYGIKYDKGEAAILVGFYDNDWGGSDDDIRSTLGYAFTLGSGIFSWASVKQQSVALSIAEVEYQLQKPLDVKINLTHKLNPLLTIVVYV